VGDFRIERRNKSNGKMRNKKENTIRVAAGMHFKAELRTERNMKEKDDFPSFSFSNLE
jgi:hypothetical protein